MYSIFCQDSFKRTSSGLNIGYVLKKEKKSTECSVQHPKGKEEQRERGPVLDLWEHKATHYLALKAV